MAFVESGKNTNNMIMHDKVEYMSLPGSVLEKVFGGTFLKGSLVNEQSQISKNSVSTRKAFPEKYGEHLSGRFIHFKYHLEKIL
jgi:hypothetical protein